MKWSTVVVSIGLLAGIGAVAAGLAMYKHRSLQPPEGGAVAYEPAEAVDVVAAREVSWRPMADLVGTVLSLRSVRVSNELAGTVKEVKFESGGVIEAGQVLLTLDDSTDRADLAAAEASIRVATANLAVVDSKIKLAEMEVRRREEAAQASAVAQIELDRAQSDLESTRADRERYLAEIDLAKAKAAQVQTRLDKMVIKAPFRARTGIRTIHEGQYLAEGTAIVMLEEVSDRIYLDFAIPQEYLARVHPGTVVMATSPVFGDEPIKIEVVAVDATVNNETRNIRVRSVVDNPNSILRPGMFIQVRVPADDAKPYVMVPATAIRHTSYADQVFVIGPGASPEQMRAKLRFVKLGQTSGEDVIVLEGLRAGERIASVGSFKLRDGALVRPAEAGAKQTASAQGSK